MNAWLVSQLVGLYPQEWRTRYGEEFRNFLEAYPSHLSTILNVMGGALRERVLCMGRFTMDRRQNSLALMLYACLGAVAGGINFYWTVDDTPLATAMNNYAILFRSWNVVRAGSVLALAAFAAVAIPVFLGIVTRAFSAKRWDVVIRFAVPPCAALATLTWMITGARLSGGHWVPTPWDVTGDWTAPRDWPPLATRWALGSVTFVLMAAGTIVSAISVGQAIRKSDLSKHSRIWFTVPSVLLAGSVAMMALAVLAWGWFVEQYATTDFHIRNGGLFGTTNFASWAATCIVLLAAAVLAVKSAHSALSIRMQ